MVLLRRFKVLPNRLFRTTGCRTFQRVAFKGNLIVRDIVRRGVRNDTRVQRVTLRRFVQVSQGDRTVRIRAGIQFGVLTCVHVFMLLRFTNQRSSSLGVNGNDDAEHVRRFDTVFTSRDFHLQRRFCVLLFHVRHRSPASFFVRSCPFSSDSETDSNPTIFAVQPLWEAYAVSNLVWSDEH